MPSFQPSSCFSVLYMLSVGCVSMDKIWLIYILVGKTDCIKNKTGAESY